MHIQYHDGGFKKTHVEKGDVVFWKKESSFIFFRRSEGRSDVWLGTPIYWEASTHSYKHFLPFMKTDEDFANLVQMVAHMFNLKTRKVEVNGFVAYMFV